MADAELAAAPPAVQESLVEAKLFGKWDFSDVEVRQRAAEMPHNNNSAVFFHWNSLGYPSQSPHMSSNQHHHPHSYMMSRAG